MDLLTKLPEMSDDALANLRILGRDGDDPIRGDAQESSGQESGRRELRRLGKDFGDGIEVEGKEDASSRDGGDAEKTAAIKKRSLHGASRNERCDAGGGGHLHHKHCKPIAEISEF